MDADWSVELDADDPALECPWSSPDGTQGYVDLSADMSALRKIPEAMQYRPLRRLLGELNASWSPWITAKCGVWTDDEISEAEEIYGCTVRMCSYVDLIRREECERFSFEQHERWAKSAVERLRWFPDAEYRAELVVRRCYYHLDGNPEESRAGFYITVYAFGYGDQETAKYGWEGCLDRISHALMALES